MPRITYFVALPYEASGRGRFRAGEAVPAQSATHAMRLAEKMGEKGGAVAFSRTGDPDFGDWEDAVVLGTYGHVPIELALVA